MPPRKKDKNGPWAKSKSKALLRAGLLTGEITADMAPKDVFSIHPEENGKWKYSNWSGNLRTLSKAIVRDKGRMKDDVTSFANDFAIVQGMRGANDKAVWHRSAAPKLLAKDVDEGKHLQMTPMELYDTRDEYKLFSLHVFRKHIYQEVDKRPKRAIRFEKKKKTWLYPELHNEHPRLLPSPSDS
jgi:hypothetical protein